MHNTMLFSTNSQYHSSILVVIYACLFGMSSSPLISLLLLSSMLYTCRIQQVPSYSIILVNISMIPAKIALRFNFFTIVTYSRGALYILKLLFHSIVRFMNVCLSSINVFWLVWRITKLARMEIISDHLFFSSLHLFLASTFQLIVNFFQKLVLKHQRKNTALILNPQLNPSQHQSRNVASMRGPHQNPSQFSHLGFEMEVGSVFISHPYFSLTLLTLTI